LSPFLFGAARTKPGTDYYEKAREMGKGINRAFVPRGFAIGRGRSDLNEFASGKFDGSTVIFISPLNHNEIIQKIKSDCLQMFQDIGSITTSKVTISWRAGLAVSRRSSIRNPAD